MNWDDYFEVKRLLNKPAVDDRYTVHTEQSYIHDPAGFYLVKSHWGEWVNADIYFETDDFEDYYELKKSYDSFRLDKTVFEVEIEKAFGKVPGQKGLPIGTRRTWKGTEFEKTSMGWKPVPEGKGRKSKEEMESHSKKVKSGETPRSHGYDFEDIPAAKLEEYAMETALKNPKHLAKFLDHQGKSQDGKNVREIVKKALKEAGKKQQEAENLMQEGRDDIGDLKEKYENKKEGVESKGGKEKSILDAINKEMSKILDGGDIDWDLVDKLQKQLKNAGNEMFSDDSQKKLSPIEEKKESILKEIFHLDEQMSELVDKKISAENTNEFDAQIKALEKKQDALNTEFSLLENTEFAESVGWDENEHKTSSYYKGNGYIPINKTLYGKMKSTPEIDVHIKNLRSALDKCENFTGIVYSGQKFHGITQKEFIKDHQVGKQVDFKAFVSGSDIEGVAKGFAEDYMYIIKSKTGKNWRKFNYSESEIVFKDRSKFKVTKAPEIKNRIVYVAIEEI